jgi:hypothetical protein
MFPLSYLGSSENRWQELQRSDSFWAWLELYQLQLNKVTTGGWPDGATRLERWLEGVLEGGWIRHVRALGHLSGGRYIPSANRPVGLGGYTYEVDGQTRKGDYFSEARGMAQLFQARAVLLQQRGQLRPALDCHRAILTLSRHLGRRSTTLDWLVGSALQSVACQALDQWAHAVREEGLLLQALGELSGQEDAFAPLLDLVRAEYLSFDKRSLSESDELYEPKGSDGWKLELYRLVRLAPWEREREQRYLKRAYKKQAEDVQLPTWEEVPSRKGQGTDPTPHPVAQVVFHVPRLRKSANHRLCRLRALRLQLALAAYRARKGGLAVRLEDLGPDLLETLPVDPWSGKPFGYRVSRGERIRIAEGPHWHELLSVMDVFRWIPLPGAPGTPWMTTVPALQESSFDTRMIEPGFELLPRKVRSNPLLEIEPHRWVAPGRGILWSVGEDRHDDGGTDERTDRIFLVPQNGE